MQATWTDYLVLASAAALLFAAVALVRRVLWQVDELDRDSRKGER